MKKEKPKTNNKAPLNYLVFQWWDDYLLKDEKRFIFFQSSFFMHLIRFQKWTRTAKYFTPFAFSFSSSSPLENENFPIMKLT
jgi:hypothetical protein